MICPHASIETRWPAPGITQSRMRGRSATVIAPGVDSDEADPLAWVVLVRVRPSLPLLRAACRTEAQANSLALVVLTESAAFGCITCQARKAKRRRAGIRAVVKGRKR